MTRRSIDPWGAVFGIGLPIAVAVAGLLLTRILQSRLPEQIATHWTTGRPDGFAEPTSSAWVFALTIVLVGGGCSAVAALAPALLLMRRTMLLLGSSVVGLLFSIQLATLVSQLDRSSVTELSFPGRSVGWGMLGGFAIGVAGGALLRDHRERTPADEPPAAGLPRGRAVAVRDRVGFSGVGLTVFVGAVLGVAALGWWTAGAPWPLWIAAPVAAIVAGLIRFDVVVDRHGVRVRNLGMTSLDIGLDEITGARVVEVNPFRDFGGWGLRTKGRGRYGIVTHTGPAVRIDTAGALTLTVTTERATEMAGALNSFADQQRRVRNGIS